MGGKRISGMEAALGESEFNPARADREMEPISNTTVVKCQHCGQRTNYAGHEWQIKREEERVRLRSLLFRARTEMFHMLDCASKEEVPHDGDDFHDTLQQIEKELGRT